jgi:hypothetical protein
MIETSHKIKEKKENEKKQSFVDLESSLQVSLKHQSIEGWASFLDQRDWHIFTTLTTARTLTLPGARRAMSKLHLLLKQNGYPAEIFFVCEPFDVKEGQHVHALAKFSGIEKHDDNRHHVNALKESWRQIVSDKNARVQFERYRNYNKETNEGGANWYVGKYLQKYKSDSDYLMPFSEHNNLLEFDNSNMFRPELKMNFRNRIAKAAWIEEQKNISKKYKSEIKAGTFESRDNSVYAGHHLKFKQLDYKFLEASMEREQYREQSHAIILKAKGAKVKYELNRKERKPVEYDLQYNDVVIKQQSQNELREKVMSNKKNISLIQSELL